MEETPRNSPPLSAEEFEAERSAVEEQIKRMVTVLLPSGKEALTLLGDMRLKEDVGLTSLDLTMLAYEIEEKWSLDITDAYRDDYRTIAEARDRVLELRGLLAPAGNAR